MKFTIVTQWVRIPPVQSLNQTTGDWHRGALTDTSRGVTPLEYSGRAICAKNDASGDSPCRASPDMGRVAPGPRRVLVGTAHFAALFRPPEPDRDCRRTVLRALDGLSRGPGVPGRGMGVDGGRGRSGEPAGTAGGADPRGETRGAGDSAGHAAGVRVVPDPLELRHDRPGTRANALKALPQHHLEQVLGIQSTGVALAGHALLAGLLP